MSCEAYRTILRNYTRRDFFQRAGAGLAGIALASLVNDDCLSGALAATAESSAVVPTDLMARRPQRTPRAKAVIHLFMNGGPSQMDLFDPKPELARRHGEAYFEKIAGEVENTDQAGALMRSPFKFAQHGQSGMWVSEALPHLARCVDKIALVRSMHTVNITHEPALYKLHSGHMLPGYPSMGSWVTYGLGSENRNLPAYVVLDDPKGLPINGTQNWQAGFLPPIFQGTRFRSSGAAVLNLDRGFDEPDDVTALERALAAQLDRAHQQARPRQPRLDARIASYELAARMQVSASDALDLNHETADTLAMYGIGEEPTDSYGRRCLMARRLVERGVRFVQLFIDGQIWDNHAKIATELKAACDRTDKPIAALLTDLAQRGLLDDVLVLWGGEMGRLPIAQIGAGMEESQAGRDHNKLAMCGWMAGGGVKQGITYGSTDELGFAAAEDPVSVADWHATVLHLLGLDFRQLAYNRNGFNEKLTGVEEARVVAALLA
ncbi:MAG: DUF1501 domain-containing protein [Pirellulales bacterium]